MPASHRTRSDSDPSSILCVVDEACLKWHKDEAHQILGSKFVTVLRTEPTGQSQEKLFSDGAQINHFNNHEMLLFPSCS